MSLKYPKRHWKSLLSKTQSQFHISLSNHDKGIGDFSESPVVKNLPASAGARALSLLQEDPTCHRATKPPHHNYWFCSLEPQLLSPRTLTIEAQAP